MGETIQYISDQRTPLVSVIMSVYNGDKYLKDAIDSICNQTYTHWEYIIIDDGSNDLTQSILEKYKEDKRFIITRNEIREGLTKNLNKAIQIAKGSLMARMDADDISLSNRFQEQVDYLLCYPRVSLVATFIDMINEKNAVIGAWRDDRSASTYQKIKKKLPFSNCIAHPSVMIRKEVFLNLKYNEFQKNAEDWDLWMQMVNHKFIIEKIPKTLLLYRVHDASITQVSLKASSFFKKNMAYKLYFKNLKSTEKFTWFNVKVRMAFCVNKMKLFLSKLKRK